MPLCFQKAGLSCLRNNTKGKTMTRKTIKAALAVGLLAVAARSLATEQSLPTPPPSANADAESSTTVPIPTDEGRHLNLTIAFDSTPSNAVQVAFGRDLNGSETLEPEETELIVGCDCGFPVVGVESSGSCSVVGVESSGSCGDAAPTATPTATPIIHTFSLKQSRIVAERWTLAKVTTHNLADTNLTVTADFYTKGTALILR